MSEEASGKQDHETVRGTIPLLFYLFILLTWLSLMSQGRGLVVLHTVCPSPLSSPRLRPLNVEAASGSNSLHHVYLEQRLADTGARTRFRWLVGELTHGSPSLTRKCSLLLLCLSVPNSMHQNSHPPGPNSNVTSSTEPSLELALRRNHFFLCISWRSQQILTEKWRRGNEWRPDPWYGDTSKSSPWFCPSIPSHATDKINTWKYHFVFGLCPFMKQLINSKPHYTTHIPIRSSQPRSRRMGLPPAIVSKRTSNKSPVSQEEQGLNISPYFF